MKGCHSLVELQIWKVIFSEAKICAMFSRGNSSKRMQPTSNFRSPEPGFSRLNPVPATGLHSEEQTASLNLPRPFGNWDEVTRYRDDEVGVTETEMEQSDFLECGQLYPQDSDETVYHDLDAPKDIAANIATVQLPRETLPLSSPADQFDNRAKPAWASIKSYDIQKKKQ